MRVHEPILHRPVRELILLRDDANDIVVGTLTEEFARTSRPCDDEKNHGDDESSGSVHSSPCKGRNFGQSGTSDIGYPISPREIKSGWASTGGFLAPVFLPVSRGRTDKNVCAIKAVRH
jgi:hypothetical protein